MNFDMNACWSRTVELVRDNFQLLLVIAAVFLMLPNIAMYLLIPDIQTLADPMADPDIVQERIGEILLPLLSVGGIGLLVQFAGYGAMVALMGDNRPTVGQALGTGLKIIPSTLAIMIAFIFAYFIGAMLVMVPVSLLAGAAGAPAIALIGVLPVLVYVVWLMARLSMSMPAMVLGGTLNPFTAMTSSFKMTGQSQWAILLFWFVISVIMAIIGFMVSVFVGLISALIGTGTVAMLILGIGTGAWSMISSMVVCGLAVAMYSQLSGSGGVNIEKTFE